MTFSAVAPGAVGAALGEAASFLHRVTDVPRLEAELLLSCVTGLSRTSLLAHPELTLSPAQQSGYWRSVRRRASGYPLPYITGRIEFYGLEMTVSPAVLIPRPETELLVDLALAQRPAVVVEAGTGSGCVAVALAVHLPPARLYATDISAAALRVAALNVARHGVGKRVQLLQGDLLAPLAVRADVVVSNPPYVARHEWEMLPPSVRHEPRLALDGGADGLDVVRRLLRGAGRILRPGGLLLVEIGAEQGDAAVALARRAMPRAAVALHRDLEGRERVLSVRAAAAA